MQVDVTVEAEIAAPVDRTAAFVADPANDTRWISGIMSAETMTDGDFGPGTRVRRVARFLGRHFDYVTEVTAYVPGVSIEMTSTSGPFPLHVTYGFEPVGASSTRVTVRNRGEPKGFFKLSGGLLAAQLRRSVTRDLARLKAILEAGR